MKLPWQGSDDISSGSNTADTPSSPIPTQLPQQGTHRRLSATIDAKQKPDMKEVASDYPFTTIDHPPAPPPTRFLSSYHIPTLPTDLTQSHISALLRRRIRIGSKRSVSLGTLILTPIVFILTFFYLTRHSKSSSSMLGSTPQPMRGISNLYDEPFLAGCQDPRIAAEAHPRENAAFVVLARNSELEGVLYSIDSLERRFNRWFNYPYVFLNDDYFNHTFKEVVRNATSSHCEFGKVDTSMFGFPDWVDHAEAKELIAQQGDRAIMYGGLESYHHMCRFYSGFFYKHPLLQKYEWYWRVEPDIEYFCDLTYDPFRYMALHNKSYGFNIAIKELRETVPNLFRYAAAYKRENKIKSQGLWEMFLEQKEIPSDKKEGPMEEEGGLPDKPGLPDEVLLMEPV